MKRSLFLLVAVLTSFGCVAQQNSTALRYASTITVSDLKDNLSIIASDALEGRNTGSRGQKMAAAFISNHFQQLGLKPPVNGSFYQPLELYAVRPSEVFLKTGVVRFENFKDVIYLGNNDSQGERQLDVIFVGLGREEDFKNQDVRNKAVLIYNEALGNFNMSLLPELTERAHRMGASMVFYMAPFKKEKFLQLGANLKSLFEDSEWSLQKPAFSKLDSGSFLVAQEVAEKLMGAPFDVLVKASNSTKPKALQKFKSGKISYQTAMEVKTLQTENVLGFLEGTDKKDEVVVITAHYDHVGKNESGDGDLIFNGADDDGSGTVAVLELAEAFAKAKKEGNGPRRSMLFMTVTGEELGLFGSEYYVTHPVFPLANTVADLNIDMIGRRDPANDGKPDYVYVIGADKLSSELHAINEKANQTYTQLRFDYVYNDEYHPDRLYYRSDHWNFAKNNIPIIFYFDGIHNDYHQVSDEVQKIDFELLAKRAKAVFFTAWEIVNRDQRLVIDR